MARIPTSPHALTHRIFSILLVILAQATTGSASAPLDGVVPSTHQTQSAPPRLAEQVSKSAGVVGPQVCAECHPSEAARQMKTPMAHAGTLAADSEILQAHPDMAVRMGPYLYRIRWKAGNVTYSVSNGSQSISVPILLAFGDGKIGQTFVFRRSGAYYEARVSFFTNLNGLDLTIGHSPAPPPSLEEALGRKMKTGETRACFSCHFTGAVVKGRLDVRQMLPGVTCEDCHGPGEQHVAAMKGGGLLRSSIFNPGHLSPADSVNFCGSCHRTLEDVRMLGLRGVLTVRFQPYRLVLSRCWNPADPRITCVACHDPHQKIRYDVSFYDDKCAACHLSRPAAKRTAARPGAACPVGRHNCVTCHMPQGELPGSHAIFTDHNIRIARPNEPFPD